MRTLHELDQYRLRGEQVRGIYGWDGDHTCGAFLVKSPIDGRELVIVASADAGWDHVSVSRKNRTPNWGEMEHIKRLFFRDDETAMQLHVPVADHINHHPYVLHLWRPLDCEIPRPPGIFVGPTRGPGDGTTTSQTAADLRGGARRDLPAG
jgi:hypothetical protein